MSLVDVPLAWQAPGTRGSPTLICKHMEAGPGDMQMIEHEITPGEPIATVDGRAVERIFVCPGCEGALAAGAAIEWRGALWEEDA